MKGVDCRRGKEGTSPVVVSVDPQLQGGWEQGWVGGGPLWGMMHWTLRVEALLGTERLGDSPKVKQQAGEWGKVCSLHMSLPAQ